jgi:threonine dehydrogenase-like Zn-dependent dehydrogenase
MGQTHVRRWTDDLLRRILEGEIDPTFLITHRKPLGEGRSGTASSGTRRTGCVKVVLQP